MNNAYWQPLNMANGGLEINIVKGEKNYLYDDTGKKYIDGYSGLWNVVLGYHEKNIINAVLKQAQELPFVNPITLKTPISTELAEKICEITHEDISKIVYTCTGSEAIETAIKFARKYSCFKNRKRHVIAIMENSYHGSYYGSMAASNYEKETKDGYGPMLEGFVSLPLPFSRKNENNKLDEDMKASILSELKDRLESNKDTLCGIIVEPVLASGGVIPLFEEYIAYINDFCNKNDILFICDEVATGFWRTGYRFRFQKFDIKPDIITLSKGLNNGYLPIGCVCVSKKIEEVFEKNKEVIFHLSTQDANPICLASALETLKRFEVLEIQKKVKSVADEFAKNIEQKIKGLYFVSEVRQIGLMIAIDLVYTREENKPISNADLMKVVEYLYRKGYIIGVSFTNAITSSLLLFPAYIMENSDIEYMIDMIKEAILKELGGKKGGKSSEEM